MTTQIYFIIHIIVLKLFLNTQAMFRGNYIPIFSSSKGTLFNTHNILKLC